MKRLMVTFGVLSSLLLGAFLSAQEQGKKAAAAANDSDWIMNDEKGVRVAIGYLKQKDDYTVCLALDALARMADKTRTAIPSPVPAICDCLKNGSWLVKIEAARTLIDLNAEAELAHKTLSDALTVKDPEVRIRLAKLMGEIVNPPIDWAGKYSCWGPGPRPMRRARPEFKEPAVKYLMTAMKDKESKVRYHAAMSLGQIGADAKIAVPVLLDALQDKEPAIRQVAAEAAKRIVIDAGAKAGVKGFEKANVDNLFK
jgi:HEAT repeat protein